MKAKINYKGKGIIIDLKKVSEIGKFTGLMFKSKDSQALLFEFKKSRQPIHSLFCPVFLAIWLIEGKIVDFQLVKPWRLSVKPEKEFDKLIEMPFNNKYSSIINVFLDGEKI